MSAYHRKALADRRACYRHSHDLHLSVATGSPTTGPTNARAYSLQHPLDLSSALLTVALEEGSPCLAESKISGQMCWHLAYIPNLHISITVEQTSLPVHMVLGSTYPQCVHFPDMLHVVSPFLCYGHLSNDFHCPPAALSCNPWFLVWFS